MNQRILLMCILFMVLCGAEMTYAQVSVSLDDVRQDILDENKEEIKSISEEIKRKKKKEAEERKRKKSAYQEKIEKTKKLEAIKTQQRILSESEDLLKSIKERTEFDSEKRWQYEELIKIYAEKPIAEMSIEEQEETANTFLASATSELIDLLKQKALQQEKQERGEEYEEITADKELMVQLNQYTQLVKRIESYKETQTEKIVEKKDTVVKSTKELIDVLKKEAIRRAELKRTTEKEEIAKQKMSFKNFEGTLGLHVGYDDNVNADKAFEGGLFLRNYFALNWIPSLNQYIKGDIGAWYLADNHFDDQDVTFRVASGQASLKLYPRGHEKLEIIPGFEFSDTHYPNSESVSTKERRLFIDSKHKFWGKWSQELNYEYLVTNNNRNRLARDGSGADRPEVTLEKRKHSMEYNFGFPLPYQATFKIKQKGTKQTSNDAFTDFYDFYSYKVGGELGRSLTEKLYAKAAVFYEAKNYTQRTVSTIEVAQEDQTYTQKVTLFYFLNADWLLNYTWTRTKADSNDSLFDYEKKTHLVGLYYSF